MKIWMTMWNKQMNIKFFISDIFKQRQDRSVVDNLIQGLFGIRKIWYWVNVVLLWKKLTELNCLSQGT